jgi:hypothetical protein
VAGLLDIAPGILEARDAAYRARVAEERAKEEKNRRIQIERTRALVSKKRYFKALVGAVVLGMSVSPPFTLTNTKRRCGPFRSGDAYWVLSQLPFV